MILQWILHKKLTESLSKEHFVLLRRFKYRDLRMRGSYASSYRLCAFRSKEDGVNFPREEILHTRMQTSASKVDPYGTASNAIAGLILVEETKHWQTKNSTNANQPFNLLSEILRSFVLFWHCLESSGQPLSCEMESAEAEGEEAFFFGLTTQAIQRKYHIRAEHKKPHNVTVARLVEWLNPVVTSALATKISISTAVFPTILGCGRNVFACIFSEGRSAAADLWLFLCLSVLHSQGLMRTPSQLEEKQTCWRKNWFLHGTRQLSSSMLWLTSSFPQDRKDTWGVWKTGVWQRAPSYLAQEWEIHSPFILSCLSTKSYKHTISRPWISGATVGHGGKSCVNIARFAQ